MESPSTSWNAYCSCLKLNHIFVIVRLSYKFTSSWKHWANLIGQRIDRSWVLKFIFYSVGCISLFCRILRQFSFRGSISRLCFFWRNLILSQDDFRILITKSRINEGYQISVNFINFFLLCRSLKHAISRCHQIIKDFYTLICFPWKILVAQLFEIVL